MPVLCSALLCLPGLAGGAGGIVGQAALLPVSAASLSPSLSHSELIPLSRNFPDMSTAIAATTTDTSTTLPSLPQGNAEASFVGGLYEAFKSRGENMLTPDGAAATLRGVESGGIAGLGSNLAQSVIDAGLQRIEQQAGQHLFRNLNLNWAPGFNGREDLYQIDAMLSLYDGERSSLMTQLGLQSRDGETGANAGLVLRTQSIEHWILGLNAFYDYLSDPDVSRWSVGAELKGRWLGLSSNIYIGLDEETRGREILYSPDGWDVELSGHVPDLPWLEYSGRYYKWDGEGSSDLEGQDYKLTLRPVPLFDISLRYDNAKDSDSGFGVETQLSYEFGRPMSEQLSYQHVASPASAWSRRFERVRREYEQRVQRRSGVPVTSVTRVTASGTGVVVQIANIPAGTTQVVVTGGIRTGNSLTRATSAASTASTVRVHGGNCHIPSISTASCTFNATTSEITIANLQPGNYNFGVSFQNAAGTDLGGQVQFTVTITGPTASIAVNNAAIAEAGGVATVTVTLDPAPASATVVNLTRTGSGTVVSDYTVATLAGTDPTYTLMVAANTATATFTVTAVDDSADDDAETAIFTIASVTGYTVASGSAAVTVTITDDDDPPTASIYIGNAGTQIGTITEAAASTTTVTVRLSPAPTSATTVNLMQSGSATVVNDYTVASLSGTAPTYTLMVAANTATATFTVTAVDDSADDNAETAIFTISSVTGYTPAAGGAAAVTVTITDDDDPPAASIYIGNAGTQIGTITEAAASSTTVTVRLSPAPTSATTVNLMQSGSATVTSDYTVASLSGTAPTYTLMVAANTATATFTVTAVDDSADDNAETAIFTISSVTGYTATAGASAVTVTITDDDNPPTPTASIAVNNPTITEAGTGSATVTVTLSSAPTTATTVNLTSSGSATIGTGNDYTVATLAGTDPAYTLTVPASMTTATFTLTAVDDMIDENNETVIFTLATGGTGYTLGAPSAVTVTITDNDTRSITSTGTSNLAVTEQSTNSYTIVLGSQPTGTVTVVMTSADTGAATVAPATLSFTTANWNTAQTVTVTGVDDTDTTNESTTISYAVSGGDYAGVTLAAQTVTVNDNDIADITATAGAGSVVLTWTNPTNSNLSSVVVSATVNGAAVDLNGATGGNDITIASAMSGASVNRSISGLTAAEHTFTIVAMDAGSTSIASGTTTATPTAVIIGAPVVTVTPSATTVPEGSGAGTGGVVTLTLTLTNPPATDVTVTVSRNGSSAAAASDYSLSAPTATLNATTLSRDITLTTTPDTVYEGDESLVLSYTVSGATGIAAVPDTTLTIMEDDAPPQFSFPTTAATVVEGVAGAMVTLDFTGILVLDTTLNVRLGGDAIITDDYITGASDATPRFGSTPMVITIDAGRDSRVTFLLRAVTDALTEGDETLTITLLTGNGYTVGTANTYTLTIMDPPVPSASIAVNPAAIAEAGTGSTTVTVTLSSAAPTGGVTVNLMQSGSATIGTGNDYTVSLTGTPPSYTLMVPATMTTATFMLTAVDDSADDDAETAIFTIATGTGYTPASGAAAVATVTITDDDAPPEFSFTTATATVAEGSDASVRIAFTGGALATAVNLSVSVDGTAVAADYTTRNGVASVDLTNGAIGLRAGIPSLGQFVISTTADALTEGDETVIITLLDGDGYTVGSTNTYTLTITDVVPVASVYIGAVATQTGTITEATGTTRSTTVTVSLDSAAPTGGVTVNLMQSGTATIGTGNDYTVSLTGTPPSYTLMVPATMTTATFMLTAVDDAIDDDAETAVFTVVAGMGYTVASGAAAVATVTITDDDPPPEVSFPTATATVAEGRNATVNIAFTGGAPLTTNVRLSVSVGGAAVAADYTTGNSTANVDLTAGDNAFITILAGRPSPVGFSIFPTADTLTEGDETLIITLLTGDGYTVGSANTYTLTITDVAPVASVYIGAVATQTGTITEATGTTRSTTVTVSLDSAAPTGGVTVNLMQSGTATIGTGNDYTVSLTGTPPSYTLMVPATMTTATFMLTAVDDTADDDDETAVFTVVAGTGYTPASGSAAIATVTITDDDAPPEFSFPTATATVAEGRNASVNIAFTGGAPLTTGVTLSVSVSGTAVAADYRAVNSSATVTLTGDNGSIGIFAGRTSPSSFIIFTTADTLTEGDETLIITLLDGDGYTVGSANTYTLTITDVASVIPSASIAVNNPAIAEAGGSATVTVSLDSAAPTGGVTVNLMQSGTATIGTGNDYTVSLTGTPPSYTLMVPATMTTATFTVTAVDDSADDDAETAIFTIATGTGYTPASGAAAVATVTITDDDAPPEFSFTTATATVAEGSNTSVNIAFTGGAPLTTTVRLSVSVGGAAVAADYTTGNGTASVTLTGDNGVIGIIVGRTSPVQFGIVATPDTLTEGDETLIITLLDGDGYTVGSANTYTLTITDDAPADTTPPSPVTGFTATPGDAQVVLSWTNPTDTDLAMVMISATAGGTAVDLNGGGTTGNDLSIAATASSTGTSTITSLTNGTEYTFSIVALDGTGNPSTAATAMATPNPSVSFAMASDSVQEGTIVSVQLQFSSELGGFPSIPVGFTGDATRGTAMDYVTGNTGSAMVGASDIRVLRSNVTTATFTINARIDTETEQPEMVILTLMAGTGYTLGTITTYTLTITDPASVIPSASIAVNNPAIAEAGGSATVTVTLSSAAPTGGVTVNLMQSGTATIGTGNDYTVSLTGTPPSYTLMVPATMTTATFTVTAVDDSADDDAETAIFTIATGTGYTPASGAAAVATVTITDDDVPPEFSFTTATATVAEGSNTSVRIAFTGGAPLTTTVRLSVSVGGTAVAADYTTGNGTASVRLTGDNGTITIIVGRTSPVQFGIVATPDALAEGDETLLITLLDGDGYTVGSANTYTLTITDPAPVIPSASIAVNNPAIAEAGGSATVTVTLSSAAPTGGVTVNLMQSGTATIGTGNDYTVSLTGTPPSYTLMVPANMTTATFMLTAVDDSADDDAETAIFTIATGTGYTPASGAAAVATVTITDDDAPPEVSFPTATATRAEGSNAVVNIAFTGGALAAFLRVSVSVVGTAVAADYTIGNGTASADDLLETNGAIGIGGGRPSPVFFVIFTTADTLTEGDETVTIMLLDGDGYTVGSANTYTLTITDVAPVIPSASIAVNNPAIAEAGGSATVTVTLSSAAPTGGVTVNLMRSGGATIGTDYNASSIGGANPNYTLMVPATMTTATFMLTAVDDTIDDDAETAVFTVVAGTGYTVGTPSVATVTITDDDDAPSSDAGVSMVSVSVGAGVMAMVTGSGSPYSGTTTVDGSVTTITGVVTPSNSSRRSIRVSASTPRVSIGDNPSDGAQGSYMFTAYTLQPGNNVFSIAVTAADGTVQVHSLTVVRRPLVAFNAATYTAREQGARAANVAVRMVSGAANTDTVLSIMLDGSSSATLATDYTLSSNLSPASGSMYNLTIPAGQTFATFYVQPIDDAVDDDNETVSLTILANAAYSLDTLQRTVVSIEDNDDVTDATLNSVGVRATAGTGGRTERAALPGTAAMTGVPGTYAVTFPSTVTEVVVRYLTTDSGATAVLSDPDTSSGATVSGTTVGSLATGNNLVDITVTAADGTTMLVYRLTINLVAATTGSTNITGISVTPTGGSAVAAVNSGSGSSTYTVQLPSGSSSATVVTSTMDTNASVRYAFPGLNFVVGNEITGLRSGLNSVAVIVTSSTGSQQGYTLELFVMSPPVLTVTPVSRSVIEGSNLMLNISSSGAPGRELTLVGTVSTTSTAAASDYTLPTISITINAAGTATPASILIPTEDDMIDENNEILVISYAVTPTEAGVVAPQNSVLTIVDNDSRGVRSSASSTALVTEGASATYTLVLTSQPTSAVTISLSSSRTIAGTVSPGSLTFSTTSWDMPQTVTLSGTTDADMDNESLFISHTITGGDYQGLMLPNQNVFVTDSTSTRPTVTITESARSVAEGGSITLQVAVSGSPGQFTLNIIAASSSTAETNDYSISPNILNFGTDSTFAPGSVITVSVPTDQRVEGDETLVLSYQVTVAGGITEPSVSPTSTSLTITDANSGTISINSGTFTESTGSTNLLISVDGAMQFDAPLDVELVYTAGTATAGTDYMVPGNRMLQIPAIIPGGGFPINLVLVRDSILEDTEQFTVTMVLRSVPSTLTVANNVATVTITDDDSANFMMGGAVTVTEGTDTVAMVEIRPTQPLPFPARLELSISATTRMTVAGVDYMPVTSVVIAAGAASTTVSIPIINDQINESTESFSLNLRGVTSQTTGMAVSFQAALLATVTINDDDPPPPEFSFPTATATVAEREARTVNIAFTGGAPPTNVNLSVGVGGTAVAADYTTINSSGAIVTLAGATPTIRISAGFTSPVTFAIFTPADTLAEGSETLTITLLDGDGYTVGSANTYTLTITD